jgi:hypothetical protein
MGYSHANVYDTDAQKPVNSKILTNRNHLRHQRQKDTARGVR